MNCRVEGNTRLPRLFFPLFSLSPGPVLRRCVPVSGFGGGAGGRFQLVGTTEEGPLQGCVYFRGITVCWVSALCLGKYMLGSDETRASCGPQNHSQTAVLLVKVSKTCSLITSANVQILG